MSTLAAAHSPAQRRVVTAALELFTRHGVGGTSLQMIADEIGVTKAAVYHQFRTKDEIVIAAATDELSRLEGVIGAAEAEPSRRAARDALLTGVVDLALERRRTVGTLLTDPALADLFADHPPFRDVMRRLYAILVDDATPEGHLQVTMLIAALSGAVVHPFTRDLDVDVLRPQLLRLARRFLDPQR